MKQYDGFRGTPWNAEPTDDWNRPPYWQDYYNELLVGKDSWRYWMVVRRHVDSLIRMLTQAGELRPPSPQSLLDAGCGIALIPHVLAYWGFQVTAIDSCENAIHLALQHQPEEEDLASCVPIWDPCNDLPIPGARVLVEDPARSLQLLRKFRAAGGSLSFLTGDWLEANLGPGSYGVVHCRNSLRCSTKPYWRRSLRRFYELLSPGGVLLLDNINAWGIQDEVGELLAESGFVRLRGGVNREAYDKYVIDMWPSG